jgi:hypothetical protein
MMVNSPSAVESGEELVKKRPATPGREQVCSLFGWLVADGWCWFVLREEHCWLVLAGCWWLVCSKRRVLLAGG